MQDALLHWLEQKQNQEGKSFHCASTDYPYPCISPFYPQGPGPSCLKTFSSATGPRIERGPRFTSSAERFWMRRCGKGADWAHPSTQDFCHCSTRSVLPPGGATRPDVQGASSAQILLDMPAAGGREACARTGRKARRIPGSECLTPQARGKEGTVVFTERVLGQLCPSLHQRLISLSKFCTHLSTSCLASVSIPSQALFLLWHF